MHEGLLDSGPGHMHSLRAASSLCRYGSPPAQFKAFWDATGGLWVKGSLVGKAVTTFVGTGTQGGGQETTHLVCEHTFLILANRFSTFGMRVLQNVLRAVGHSRSYLNITRRVAGYSYTLGMG